jgi:hypothetical protein
MHGLVSFKGVETTMPKFANFFRVRMLLCVVYVLLVQYACRSRTGMCHDIQSKWCCMHNLLCFMTQIDIFGMYGTVCVHSYIYVSVAVRFRTEHECCACT